MDQAESEALTVYRGNCERLRHFFRTITQDLHTSTETLSAVRDEVRSLSSLVDTLNASLNSNASAVLTDILSRFRALASDDHPFSTVADNWRDHPFLFEWMLVMVVTFAEAYVEHALLLIAAVRPGLIASKERVISGDDILSLDTKAPDERWPALLVVARQCWAANFMRGRPGQWLSRLEKCGAPKYEADLGHKLNAIWDKRHAIIHAGPTAALASTTPKHKYRRTFNDFIDGATLIDGFVESTDSFVVSLEA